MPFEVIIGAWVATGLTLFIFTFLYEDNPIFKLAEHLYVGISVGYTIVKAYDTVIVHLIYVPMIKEGDWSLLVPVGLGLLMLARYVPKAAWLSRYAFAFIVGVGAGLAIPRTISSFILKQVEDTIRPLVVVPFDRLVEVLFSSRAAFAFFVVLLLAIGVGALYALVRFGLVKLSGALQVMSGLLTAAVLILLYRLRFLPKSWDTLAASLRPIGEVFDINSLVVLLGVACVLFYFFFSLEHTGPGKTVARTGILFLMIAFGAAFGYTVMARMSLLIGRFTDLIEFAGPGYGRPTLWLTPLVIAALVVWSLRRASRPPEA